MDDCKVFVGLDYHKDSVQVCVENQSGQVLVNRSCRNDWRSIVKAVDGHGIVSRVAIESCSGAPTSPTSLFTKLAGRSTWLIPDTFIA